MSRTGWLVLIVTGCSVAGMTLADPPSDSSVETRLHALEQRVSVLEQKEAARERQPAVAPAPAAPAMAPVAPAAATGALVATPAQVAPAAAPRWQDPANWAMLRMGMTWSQVKAILGVPGKVEAGVFSDVMYFPDSDGGRVEFDRNGRVSKWTETPDK